MPSVPETYRLMRAAIPAHVQCMGEFGCFPNTAKLCSRQRRCFIDPERMTDDILAFLRQLHADGWDDGLDALFCGIAEVEGMTQHYTSDQINTLAKKLITEVKFSRKAFKAGGN